MPHPDTSEATLDLLVAFALGIGQIPILLAGESSGYVFNAMLKMAYDINQYWADKLKDPVN